MERVGLLSLALHKIEGKKKSRIRRASWAARSSLGRGTYVYEKG